MTPHPARRARTPQALAATVLLLTVCGCARTYRFDDLAPMDLPAIDVLQLRWQRELAHRDIFDFRPQEWASAAVTRDGRVFIGSSAGHFTAFDRRGRVLWRVRTNGAVSSQPLLAQETRTVYFGADDGKMYAVDAETGKLRWSYTTQGTLSRPPVLDGGLLLFTSSEDRIYALDAANGRWRWQYDRQTPEGFTIQGYAGVLVHRGLAYTGFSDGRLVALKAKTGEVVWTRSLAGNATRFVDVDATPLLVGSELVTSSYASGVSAVSPDSGSIRWHFPIEGASSAVATRDRLFFTAPKAGLVSVDMLGRQLWRQTIPEGVPSAPVVRGRYVFVTGTESGLYVASARTGELLQTFDPGDGISAVPTVGAGIVTVLSNHGRLFVFSLR